MLCWKVYIVLMFTTGCMLALFVGIEIVFCGKEFAPLTFIKWLCVIMETVYLAQQAARAHPKQSNTRGPDRLKKLMTSCRETQFL